jgi:electron transport complex protein RnfG
MNLGLKLLLICVVAAAALGATFSVTKDPIAKYQEETAKAANQAVCPGATDFVEMKLGDFQSQKAWNESYSYITQVLKAQKDGKTLAYVIKVNGSGYNGTMMMTAGVDLTGKLTAMTIDSMNETPGLGSNATKDEFRNQYTGKSTETALTVTKNDPVNDTEIKALSGATITSRAVTDAINTAGAFAQAFLLR